MKKYVLKQLDPLDEQSPFIDYEKELTQPQFEAVSVVDGPALVIAGAGSAAHLAGAVAAHTTLPVIGVPIDSSPLNGLDALLSTAQMPGGVPVATMAIGEAGARNAGILSAEILALGDGQVRQRLRRMRKRMSGQVAKAQADLRKAKA